MALVTGAARGIGRAVALSLGREGAAVVVTDVDPVGAAATARAIEDAGGRAAHHVLDVTDPHAHEVAVEYARSTFGGLDAAVNNAGITLPARRVGEMPPEDWDRVLRVNLDGVFHGVQAQLPLVLERGGGTIIAVSSVGSVRALEGLAHYTVAKHAVNGLMKTLSWEYGRDGVRALAVGPGYINTDLGQNMSDERREALPGLHALGRLGEPHEVGDLVAWLCSDRASFLTGAFIPVDGGYTAR